MSTTTFKVAKVTKSNAGKTAVITLTTGITLFGIPDAKRNVYYLGGLTATAADTLKLGQELQEDLANFWQVKRPFEHPVSKQMIKLTWLHSKIQYPAGPPALGPNDELVGETAVKAA